MKVWLVTNHEYEYTEVIAIATTLEKAKAFLKQRYDQEKSVNDEYNAENLYSRRSYPFKFIEHDKDTYNVESSEFNTLEIRAYELDKYY